MTLEYRCSNCGTLLQTTNADPLNEQMDRLTRDLTEARAEVVSLRKHNDGLVTIEAQKDAEIERLRAALKTALGQWSMYADMVERVDGFDMEKEQSPEADQYRRLKALADGRDAEQNAS